MKDLLIVGIGVMGRPYLGAAAKLGCQIRAVDTEAGSDEPGVTYYRVRDGLEESWLEGVTRAIGERPPDGIVAFAEPQVIAAALAQDQLGLPGPSLHAAMISRNKALQRARCGVYGIPQPAYLLTDDLSEARAWMRERYPVVVKPVDRSGSEGVELVTGDRSAEDVIARRASEGKLLVEQAILGPEYSWEALVRDGDVCFENITEKETTPTPYFVELSHRCGHRFPWPAADQVEHLTRGVLRAIGMRTGLVHLEFRMADSGPVLMEVAVRTPGDYLADAVGLAHGVDLYEAAVRLALDLPLPPLAGPVAGDELRAYSATAFVTSPPGRIREIVGEAEIAAHPAVVRVRLRRGPGDVVAPLTSSDQRLGHVLISAGSRGEREAALALVRERLRVSVDTGPEPAHRLSANELPGPPLPASRVAAADRVAEIHRYPDWHCRELTDAIAAHLKVPAAQVATGVGSVGVTQQLIQATRDRGDEIVYAWRSFEAYPHLTEINGATGVAVPLCDERHDLAAMADAVTERTRLVFVCNPNNPTGTVVRRAELARFLARLPEQTLVVLDEAYREFVSDSDVPDGVDLCRDHPNLVVLRTFSKAYGLAGLRVGYAIAAEPVAAAVRACAVPFGVTDLGQAAAIAALRAEDEVRERVGDLIEERERLAGGLRELGLRVPPTEANFVWVRLGERAEAFAAACQEAGVLVRCFGGEGVRVTVGAPAANRTVLRVASEFPSG